MVCIAPLFVTISSLVVAVKYWQFEQANLLNESACLFWISSLCLLVALTLVEVDNLQTNMP